MENKEFFYSFIKQVEQEENFQFYDINFHNGYFLFEGDEDSIIDFKIKGLDSWLFGAWVCKDEHEDKYLQVFCQYEMFIDKFKPSRGDFSIAVNYNKGAVELVVCLESECNCSGSFLFSRPVFSSVFFCSNDNPYFYIPEWKAKLKMCRAIRVERKYQKQLEKTYKLIQKTIKIAAKLKIFQTMYSKDQLNKEPSHINDIYYVYTPNKLAKIIVKYLQYKKSRFFSLGSIWDYSNKAVWMAEYNGMKYDIEPKTKEEIEEECLDIKEKQKTEYKKQYDRLIKYIWED